MAGDSDRLLEGRLVRWNEDRGFGFIRPDNGEQDVFLHISCLPGGSAPRLGSRWVFSAGADPKGRGLRVIKAVPAGGETAVGGVSAGAATTPYGQRTARPSRPSTGRRAAGHDQRGRPSSGRPRGKDQSLRALPLDFGTALVAAATLFCLAAAGFRFGASGWVLVLYPLMSLIAYLMYARDKLSALRGKWRVPESSLHLVELLGGWPGAYVAQQTMRHKTVKASYQATYWLIVALHVAVAAIWLLAPEALTDIAHALLQAV